jgi:hypothetical protein
MKKEKRTDLQKKKVYTTPAVKQWGTIADLTKTGLTHSGDDGKVGSILHSKGQ